MSEGLTYLEPLYQVFLANANPNGNVAYHGLPTQFNGVCLRRSSRLAPCDDS